MKVAVSIPTLIREIFLFCCVGFFYDTVRANTQMDLIGIQAQKKLLSKFNNCCVRF